MSHATPIVRGFERHDPCADSSHRAIVTQLIDTIGGNASAWALTQNTVLTAVMGLVEAVYANAKANLTLAEAQFAPETGSELQRVVKTLTTKASDQPPHLNPMTKAGQKAIRKLALSLPSLITKHTCKQVTDSLGAAAAHAKAECESRAWVDMTGRGHPTVFADAAEIRKSIPELSSASAPEDFLAMLNEHDQEGQLSLDLQAELLKTLEAKMAEQISAAERARTYKEKVQLEYDTDTRFVEESANKIRSFTAELEKCSVDEDISLRKYLAEDSAHHEASWYATETAKGFKYMRERLKSEEKEVIRKTELYFDHAVTTTATDSKKSKFEILSQWSSGDVGQKQVEKFEQYRLNRGAEMWAIMPDYLYILRMVDSQGVAPLIKTISNSMCRNGTKAGDYSETVLHFREKQLASLADAFKASVPAQVFSALTGSNTFGDHLQYELTADPKDGIAILSAGINMYYRRGRKEQAAIKTRVYALTESFGPTKGSPLTALGVLRAELQLCQELGIPLAYDRLMAPICRELITRFHSIFGSEGSTGLQGDLNLPDQPDDAGPSMLEVVAKIQRIISSQPNTEWSTAPQHGGAALAQPANEAGAKAMMAAAGVSLAKLKALAPSPGKGKKAGTKRPAKSDPSHGKGIKDQLKMLKNVKPSTMKALIACAAQQQTGKGGTQPDRKGSPDGICLHVGCNNPIQDAKKHPEWKLCSTCLMSMRGEDAPAQLKLKPPFGVWNNHRVAKDFASNGHPDAKHAYAAVAGEYIAAGTMQKTSKGKLKKKREEGTANSAQALLTEPTDLVGVDTTEVEQKPSKRALKRAKQAAAAAAQADVSADTTKVQAPQGAVAAPPAKPQLATSENTGGTDGLLQQLALLRQAQGDFGRRATQPTGGARHVQGRAYMATGTQGTQAMQGQPAQVQQNQGRVNPNPNPDPSYQQHRQSIVMDNVPWQMQHLWQGRQGSAQFPLQGHMYAIPGGGVPGVQWRPPTYPNGIPCQFGGSVAPHSVGGSKGTHRPGRYHPYSQTTQLGGKGRGKGSTKRKGNPKAGQ